jgi:hypothetical protein
MSAGIIAVQHKTVVATISFGKKGTAAKRAVVKSRRIP